MVTISMAYLYLMMSVLCIFIGVILKSNTLLKFAKLFAKTILMEQEYIRTYKFICILAGIYFGIISYILFKMNDYRIILISMPPLLILIVFQLWNNKKHIVR